MIEPNLFQESGHFNKWLSIHNIVTTKFVTTMEKEASSAYKTILQCRHTDVNLFSTRSNICLAIQGGMVALMAGPILELKPDAPLYSKVVISIFLLVGIAITFSSLRLLQAASSWVSYWENKLKDIEGDVFNSVEIFRNHPTKENIDKGLCSWPDHEKYVSSRRTMINIFRTLLGVWIVLIIYIVLLPCLQGFLG